MKTVTHFAYLFDASRYHIIRENEKDESSVTFKFLNDSNTYYTPKEIVYLERSVNYSSFSIVLRKRSRILSTLYFLKKCIDVAPRRNKKMPFLQDLLFSVNFFYSRSLYTL